MKLSRIFFWAIFAITTYHLYFYVKVHTSEDVVVYKRFADAMMVDDTYDLGKIVADKQLLADILSAQTERQSIFENKRILFTYYVVKKHLFSNDGETVYIHAEQVHRINPPGRKSLIGVSEIRIRQIVKLDKIDDAWHVVQFADSNAEGYSDTNMYVTSTIY
ncbi:MAG: hypothetical protein ACSHX8_15885 [Opitutaceae bacterium]